MPPLSAEWPPDRIKALRSRLGLTQTEFADELGYSRKQSVSDLERGTMEPSTTICRLFDHLDARGPLDTVEGDDQ